MSCSGMLITRTSLEASKVSGSPRGPQRENSYSQPCQTGLSSSMGM